MKFVQLEILMKLVSFPHFFNFFIFFCFSLCDKTANETRKVQILWTPNQVTQTNEEPIQIRKSYPFDLMCSDSPRL